MSIPVKEQKKTAFLDLDIAVSLWTLLMSTIDQNKYQELIFDQAVKHVAYLYLPFTSGTKTELAILIEIQRTVKRM